MQATSALWETAVRSGFPVVSTVDVYRAGGPLALDVPWTKPSTITVDEGAATWRSCSITVGDIDHTLLPKTPQDALAPYGPEMVVRTGFRFPDGHVEQVPVGVFRIVRSDPTRKGLVTLTGYDRSFVVARARFEVPRVFDRFTNRSRAIAQLIAERVPGVRFSFVDTGDTLPLTVFEEGERYGTPWKACTEMAEAGGQQVFFGPAGDAVLRLAPDLATSPIVWSFIDGEGSTKIDMVPRMDASEAYNVFVTTGESAELAMNGVVPVRASAEITDPASPIYPGTFGRAPTFLASTFIKTNVQAQQVSDANLPLRAGGSESLAITGFPNPAFEAGDVAYAEDETLGIARSVVLSRFAFDLGLTDEVTYSCRTRRIT